MHRWNAVWILLAGALVLCCQPTPQSSGASIEGTVLNEVTGEPLKNATVRLADWSQQTNEQGQFVFVGVSSGKWPLSADKGGFDTGYFGARKYIPTGKNVLVKESEHIKNVVLKLVPQAVISGRVLDSDGAPVEGAQVEVLKAGYVAGVRQWSRVASVATLDNGAYRVPKLRAGQYLLRGSIASVPRAPSAQGADTALAATYYPHATDTASAIPVDASAGPETAGIDIRLVSTGVFRVRGRLQPPNGQEADGYVALIDKADPAKALRSAYVLPPDYRMDFSGLLPGSYIAYAWWYAGGMGIDAQSLEVTDKDVDDLVLAPTGREIRGSLTVNPVGRQVDLRKTSVGLVPVELDGSSAHFNPIDILIGDDLKFGFQIPYQPRFASFGLSVSRLPDGCYVAAVQYGGKKVTGSTIQFSNGAALEISIGSDGARVAGKTVDQDGKALGGAVVALIPADPVEAPRSWMPMSSISDNGGTFQFTSVPPGAYKLLAWDDVAPDNIADPDFVKRFDDLSTAVKVAAGDTISVSVAVITQ